MDKFNHKEIEEKWRKKWENSQIYSVKSKNKDNEYVLVEFPYPSGNLHVGHWYAFAVTDIYARYRKMLGKNVLFPIGFDAFGLPAENAAIKNKVNPRDWTYSNMEIMERQLRNMGAMFDWDRKIATCDPRYYKWTQWLFIQFLNSGLAYQKRGEVNWCPSCKTVLANEQVVAGKCERCESDIEKKEMTEWKLKITDYAEKLLDGLDKLDWPSHIKEAQRNWIGKSVGTHFEFPIKVSGQVRDGVDGKIKVFTTRPDTYFGITYLVLAPENKIIDEFRDKISNWKEIEDYRRRTGQKTELQRISEAKEKTGVKIEGLSCIHPGTEKEIPVFISDYVIASYGTGAVMAVPAHDERDYEFAQKFGIEIKKVIKPHCVDKLNPPLNDKKTVERDAILAVLKNPKTDKYLTLRWKKQDWHTFITGGIDEGEDPIEGAKREILEETGYKNVKFKKYLGGPTRTEFFAAHKDENRIANMHVLLFELLDEEMESISEDEKEIHEIEWIERKDITEDMRHAEISIILNSIDTEKESAFEDYGILFNSKKYDNLDSKEGGRQITKDFGKETTNYKIRDWSVSRQRYWGCPIPVIHCEKCGVIPEEESNLPIELPELDDFTPSDDGKSPLAKAEKWVKTKCPKCGEDASRETDTLDTFIDSSWYFMRYLDPKNEQVFCSKEEQENWMPVNMYSGGSEHTTMHLLYSRFFQKVLFDLKLVTEDEPYTKRNNRGLILGPDGNKMSKSKGNVIDPDELVERLGADTVRAYLAFIGPYNEAGSYPWDPNGVVGTRRFIERIIDLKQKISKRDSDQVLNLLHKTIKGVSEDYESMKFNTGISKLMILSNLLEKEEFSEDTYKKMIQMFSPVAPYACEEMWSQFENDFIHNSKWPEYEEKYATDKEVQIIIQVNGKFRQRLKIEADLEDSDVKTKVKNSVEMKKWLSGKKIKKVIYVKNRLINFVIEE